MSTLDRLRAADWIEPDEDRLAPAGERPGYQLRQEFTAAAGDRAVVSATAHGIYELFVNGTRVGEEELTPGFTAYRSRLAVQEWDVTDLIVPGANVIGAILSDGWFRGRHGFERHADGFGTHVALLAALELGEDRIVTNGDWDSRPSQITRADLMDGQTTDFRRDAGWGGDGWSRALVVSGGLYDDRDRLFESEAPPVRRIEELAPAVITRPAPDVTVVDFGQNINGWVRLSLLGPAGTQLTLTHGEALDPDGAVTTENLRAFDFAAGTPLPAGQVDRVISAGREGDTFEPRHTTHGFQFVQLDGALDLGPDDIRAVVVHTELERVGDFSCSDERLNRLYDAAVWSFRGNACDIPTDCPQRERSGFTGDWQVFLPAATGIYDVRAFTEKWLDDVAADQWEDGRIPTISPNPAGAGPSGVAFADLAVGSAGWGDAAVLVPWELWRAYGDPRILERRLPMMRRWVDYAAGMAESGRHPARAAARPDPAPHERYLWDTGFHFGEWLEPGVPPSMDPAVDRSIVATAFLARSSELLARIGALLGDDEVVAHYTRIAEGARDAWRGEFIGADGRLTEESQANYVRGLAFELFPEQARPTATRLLVELIGDAGGHLGTGFLSTAQLLPALADHGALDTAYEVLLSTGPPSWLEMLDRGATTIWEWWDGIDGGAARGSLNHYSKGAVISFLQTHVAGIRRPEPTLGAAGYREIIIAPRPGGGLTTASASLRSAAGLIRSEWVIAAGEFELTVEVPPGTTARIELPDGSGHPAEPGISTFTCPAP
jgi:alpha-L-rhamnosidase